MVRILIADDSSQVRQALRIFIDLQPGWLVCGEAVDGCDAVAQTRELLPDLVILDFLMPGMNGLRAAREIRRIIPGLPVLLFTMHLSKQLVEEAQSAGIRGALSKSCFGQVPEAIEALLHKETFYCLESVPYAA